MVYGINLTDKQVKYQRSSAVYLALNVASLFPSEYLLFLSVGYLTV